MPAKTDVIVLGAGMVGVSIAVHLANKGRSVVLVDRRDPGEETSFGNAGLIQREGVTPHAFPRDIGTLGRYALNNSIEAVYDWRALPGLMPFLARYWWQSAPHRYQQMTRLYAPLIEHSLTEHETLIKAAGAQELIRKQGWLWIYRTQASLQSGMAHAENLSREFGVNYNKLSREELAKLQPGLSGKILGAVRWLDPWSVTSPHALVVAYAKYFQSLGGRLELGDARTLETSASDGWRVETQNGPLSARQIVVALGPWADVVTRKLGYRLPLTVKRGYHMHYGVADGFDPRHTMLDAERGYVLAPMQKGLRLTTGAEFAHRDATKNPVQLERAEKAAREVQPLGARLDDEPWMGARPCTPDMMPIIGKAPRHEGVWFAVGHAHHGLTLGPITGRALSEQMLGEKPVIDLTPYRAERFRI